jgi:hypothetical protein
MRLAKIRPQIERARRKLAKSIIKLTQRDKERAAILAFQYLGVEI